MQQTPRITEDDMRQADDRIRSAVRTLRRIPGPMARSRMTSWPDIVQEFWDAYGYSDPTPPKLVPTPQQISNMDEVIKWLAWLTKQTDARTTRTLWAVASNHSLRKVGRVLGCSHNTVKARYEEALYLIASEFVRK